MNNTKNIKPYLKKIGKIAYYDLGNPQGQPILFIHGWHSDSRTIAKYCLKYYEKDFRCIFVDMLGWGNSEMYTKEKSIGVETAEMVGNLIKELDLKDIIIYGHCVGGNIGTLVYCEVPERVKAFVWTEGLLYLEGVQKLLITKGIRYPVYKFFLQNKYGIYVSNYFGKLYKKIPDSFIRSQKRQDPIIALDWIYDLFLMTKKKYSLVINEIYCPSLYLTGDNTMKTVYKSRKLWMEKAPNPETKSIPNSKHFAGRENPAVLNQYVMEFINKINMMEENDFYKLFKKPNLYTDFYKKKEKG